MKKFPKLSAIDAIILALLLITSLIYLFTSNSSSLTLVIIILFVRLLILIRRKLFYKIKYRLIFSSLFFIITPIILITIFFYLALNIIIMQYNLAIFENITRSDLDSFNRSCEYYLALNDENRIVYELNRWKNRRPKFFNVLCWRLEDEQPFLIFSYPEDLDKEGRDFCNYLFKFDQGYFKMRGNIYHGVFKKNLKYAIAIFQSINQQYFQFLPRIGDFSLKFIPPENSLKKGKGNENLTRQIEQNLDEDMFSAYRFPLPYFYKYRDFDFNPPVERVGSFLIVNNIAGIFKKLKSSDNPEKIKTEIERYSKSLQNDQLSIEQKEELINRINGLKDRLQKIEKSELSTGSLKLQQFLIFLVILFAAFIIVSLFIGYRMIRVITVAIDELMKGTSRILRGDFSYRIKLKSRDQFYELASSFNEMSAGIEKLLIEEKEKQRMEEELRIARAVQMKLLPDDNFKSDHFELTAVNIPAKEIAGDYFDYFYSPQSHFLGLVADVSGKGAPAAFYMAELKGIISYLQREKDSPREIIALAHQSLAKSFEKTTFITLNIARFNIPTSKMIFARSGHTPALFYRAAEKKCLELTPRGIAIGLQGFQIEKLEEVEIDYQKDDLLCFFSDGLSEITNGNDQMFGVERLKRIIEKNAQVRVEQLREIILNEVFSFSQNQSPFDDLTFLIIRVKR